MDQKKSKVPLNHRAPTNSAFLPKFFSSNSFSAVSSNFFSAISSNSFALYSSFSQVFFHFFELPKSFGLTYPPGFELGLSMNTRSFFLEFVRVISSFISGLSFWHHFKFKLVGTLINLLWKISPIQKQMSCFWWNALGSNKTYWNVLSFWYKRATSDELD